MSLMRIVQVWFKLLIIIEDEISFVNKFGWNSKIDWRWVDQIYSDNKINQFIWMSRLSDAIKK